MKKLLVLALMSSLVVLAGCTKTPAATDTTNPTADTTAATNGGEAPVAVDTEKATALAQCLTDKGVKMYGTEWCGHCKNQKAMFGDAFAKVTYIDCDAQRQECIDAGVKGFPTWIDAQKNQYPGTQQLDKLAQIAGCEM